MNIRLKFPLKILQIKKKKIHLKKLYSFISIKIKILSKIKNIKKLFFREISYQSFVI